MKVKATKVIDISKFFNVEFNKKYPIVTSVFAAIGIICGVVLTVINETAEIGAAEIFTKFCTVNQSLGVPEMVISSFLQNIIIILFLMFLGFSSVGYLFVYLAPFFKGLGLGAMCGYIYSSYLLKGVAYCCFLIFPAAVLQLFALMLACNESIQMSKDIQNIIRKNGNTETKIRTDLYVLRYAVITFAVLLAAVLYSIGVVLFFRLL